MSERNLSWHIFDKTPRIILDKDIINFSPVAVTLLSYIHVVPHIMLYACSVSDTWSICMLDKGMKWTKIFPKGIHRCRLTAIETFLLVEKKVISNMIVHSSQPIRALHYNWLGRTKLNCWLGTRPVQKDNQSYTSHAPEKRFFGNGLPKVQVFSMVFL